MHVMAADQASQYDEVKRVLLHEFKLSSSALLDRFNSVSRQANETFTLYGQRLKSTLSYYVESRKAERYDLLIELLVCDRIKSQLSDVALRHILSVENQTADGWLHLDKLVESLDSFYATHSAFDRPKFVQSAISGTKQKPPRPPSPAKASSASGKFSMSSHKPGNDKSSPKRCFTCGSDQHLANFHSRNSSRSAANADDKPARVYSCHVGADSSVSSCECVESRSSAKGAAVVPSSAEVPVTSSTPSAVESQATCSEVVVEAACDVRMAASTKTFESGPGIDPLAPPVFPIDQHFQDVMTSYPKNLDVIVKKSESHFKNYNSRPTYNLYIHRVRINLSNTVSLHRLVAKLNFSHYCQNKNHGMIL
jgi:hypothetical protein